MTTAALGRRRVIVDAIETDPLCESVHQLAREDGLASCHVQPILAPDGEALGAVMFFYRQAHQPAKEDVRLLEWAARLAGLTIERKQSAEALERRVEERTKALERAQQETRQHQSELAHVARVSAVGEMASGLAHELNQPLTAIVNYAEAGLVSSPLPDRIRADLTRIVGQAHRAANIVRRLRSFVRTADPVRVVTTLGDGVVAQVVPLVEVEAHRHAVQVTVREWEGPCTVAVNIPEIQQVILNLARNAIEAMSTISHGERTVSIEVAKIGDAEAEISVRDTGPGIPAEDMEQLFEAFYTTKKNGMGLGLSIARTIVEEHEGRLWVTRNRDRGVTFHFRLPLCARET